MGEVIPHVSQIEPSANHITRVSQFSEEDLKRLLPEEADPKARAKL
jgi:hypothetical protein